jgi:hypothetical protein
MKLSKHLTIAVVLASTSLLFAQTSFTRPESEDGPDIQGPSTAGLRPLPERAAAINPDQALQASLNATIRYGKSCGFASSGREAFVTNKLKNRSVRVTVRTHWRAGIDDGHRDKVHVLPAGGEECLGCTVSGGIPSTSYSFEVVGCEVL